MSIQDKLFALKYGNHHYYALPKSRVTSEITKYYESFIMSNKIFVTRLKRFKIEILNEVEMTKDKKTILLPRFLGEDIASRFGIEFFKKWNIPYTMKEYPGRPQFITPPMNDEHGMVYNAAKRMMDAQDGCTLQLNTGKAKSWIATKIYWNYWQPTVMIVFNKVLQKQMITEIRQHTSITTICRIGSNAKAADKKMLNEFMTDTWTHSTPFIGVAIYISANDLYQNHKDDFWSKIYLTIYDECQCYCNNTGMALVKQLQTPKKLALSATPDDKWNTKLIQLWCGSLYNGDLIMEDRKIVGHVKIINYYGPKVYSESQKNGHGTNSFVATVRITEEDDFRTQLCIEETMKLYNDGHVVLCYFQYNNYLQKVAAMFDPNINTGILISGVDDDEVERVKNESRIIFTNYKYANIGLNVKTATAMVYYQPQKTGAKQANGRVLRETSDKVRYYIDVVDMRSFLGAHIAERKVDYVARGYTIEIATVKADQIKKN